MRAEDFAYRRTVFLSGRETLNQLNVEFTLCQQAEIWLVRSQSNDFNKNSPVGEVFVILTMTPSAGQPLYTSHSSFTATPSNTGGTGVAVNPCILGKAEMKIYKFEKK